MWSLALSIYVGCKWLTLISAAVNGAPIWRQVAYFLLWPGMDADSFLTPTFHIKEPPVAEWLFAVGKLLLGAGIFFGLARALPRGYPYLIGWLGMLGIILMLHFGAFHLASCAWRAVGVNAQPLMNWPVVAVSLGDFWGGRWNTAFRDLTYRFLFHPLKRLLGPRPAILLAFLVSGLVHDLVISVPSGGGYGCPTAYFLIEAAGIITERSRLGRMAGLRKGARGWAFTTGVVVAPACALFHPPFVLRIIIPFMRTLGAI
jgi:alginate O-acetyltransferase complex protein AlgI